MRQQIRLGDEKRINVILLAARRIATERGFEYVNHGNVAKRCAVPTSVPTVRHYFPTKDDLWRETIGNDPALLARAVEAGWSA